MPKGQRFVGREPLRNLPNYAQSVKRSRLAILHKISRTIHQHWQPRFSNWSTSEGKHVLCVQATLLHLCPSWPPSGVQVSLTHSPTHAPTHSRTHSVIQAVTHSGSHSLTHQFRSSFSSGVASFELGAGPQTPIAALKPPETATSIQGPRHMNLWKYMKGQRQSVMPCRKERIGRICRVILKKYIWKCLTSCNKIWRDPNVWKGQLRKVHVTRKRKAEAKRQVQIWFQELLF